MFDYKLLHALAMVIEHGGFEKAAGVLHITQSAVSQRIRQLEDTVGTALVVRTTPVTATATGKRIAAHYMQVRLLEHDLLHSLGPSGSAELPPAPITIPLAVNADSLATWLLEGLAPVLATNSVVLDIRVADQEQTHTLLKTGSVLGCVSAHGGPFQGCSSTRLGNMLYHCCASPDFVQYWFPNGLTLGDALKAPAVTYDRDDTLHQRLLQVLHAQDAAGAPPPSGSSRTHYLPDSHVFVTCCVQGCGYGMIPIQQAAPHLQAGRLVDLAPQLALPVELYWHHWNIHTAIMDHVSTAIIQHTSGILA